MDSKKEGPSENTVKGEETHVVWHSGNTVHPTIHYNIDLPPVADTLDLVYLKLSGNAKTIGHLDHSYLPGDGSPSGTGHEIDVKISEKIGAKSITPDTLDLTNSRTPDLAMTNEDPRSVVENHKRVPADIGCGSAGPVIEIRIKINHNRHTSP